MADLDEERRRAAALARSWAGELEALPGLPRERWPAAVRRLVDGLERDSTAAGQAQALPADRWVWWCRGWGGVGRIGLRVLRGN